MTVYIILGVYALIVLAISLRERNAASVSQFVIGKGDASWYAVAAAIFSLIGGGEIVALTALAFSYGPSAISLFGGYAAGFVVLGMLSPYIKKDVGNRTFVSLPDFIHDRFGPFAGQIVFACSFLAFFALLMIQFSAGGTLVSSLTGISYTTAAILIGLIVTSYLAIGGFRTVILTDLLQGFSRLALSGLLLFAFISSGSSLPLGSAPPEALPMEVVVGLLLTGFFTATASADVWQRVYAAESDRAAFWGLSAGAALMLLFGLMLVYLGVVAKAIAPASAPDAAFTTALNGGLAPWAVMLAMALVLISVLSTADTEIFVLASLLGREVGRDGAVVLPVLEASRPPTWARVVVVLVGIASTMCALYFTEVLTVYIWLLALLLAISPAVLCGFVIKKKTKVVGFAVLANLMLLGGLGILGVITAESAFWIVVPGFVLMAIAYLGSRIQTR